ncbi:hypothetical protein GCM10007167_27210 [Vulcaniibacterium thermophilum]|jgi:hypothetical protein|uniref:Uncharacterized protein n=2 Tax=Vulcaniibacterium thermophilum TaxID=1169913 RepID=A0A919DHT9_9GAMM|nr:hypothetical protein GCM10007167_27210 [Vulcaniibacterium thermophilum]
MLDCPEPPAAAMADATPLRTVEAAAAALETLRARLPALVQAHPDLNDFLAVFRAECVPLLQRADDPAVRAWLQSELELILTELRAWPAADAWALATLHA